MIISVYLPIVSLIHRLQAEFLGVVYFLLFDGRTMGLLRDTAMIFHDKVRLLCRVTSLRGQPLVHFLYRFWPGKSPLELVVWTILLLGVQFVLEIW